MSQELPLSYQPVGLATTTPDGFQADKLTIRLGSGEDAFAKACSALREWEHFHLGWVEVFPKLIAIEPGAIVAVIVRHLGFWSINGCQVVYLVGDGAREFGFAYGTLTNHAESGEEVFRVSLCAETGEVTYTIRAVSRPRAPLARLGYPVTRALQARFRRDSGLAMLRAAGS